MLSTSGETASRYSKMSVDGHAAFAKDGAADVDEDVCSHEYPGRLTGRLLLAAITAAAGGLLFGLDMGIAGGITQMEGFLALFFPHILARQQTEASASPYCKYDDHILSLVVSSIYLAGSISTVVGSFTSRYLGRKATMVIAGCCFIVGIVLCASAVVLSMLITGRILVGFGIGLANQAVPIYLSEVAPAKMRGRMNNMFQLAIAFGNLVSQLINYGTQNLGANGWRVSFAVLGAPIVAFTGGALALPDSPNSLAERGRLGAARAALERIRGTRDVDLEMRDIMAAVSAASPQEPWALLLRREYRAEMAVAAAVAFGSQINGINAILFFAPVIFSSLGSSRSSALLSAVSIGGCLFLATFVAIALVDRAGRRALLLQGSIQMLLSEAAVAALLAVGFAHGADTLPKPLASAVLAMLCTFVAAFAWSWGPLGWLIPSEIQPLETRCVGQSFATVVNFLVAFAIGQSFLSTLCALRWGAFLLYAALLAAMAIFVAFFLPETRGVPIEAMHELWARHWYAHRTDAEK